MINLRFHLVSLIAVFLALAVGIFVGSTVVDQAIVENLDRQIDRVEKKADESDAENDRLNGDLQRLGAWVEESSRLTVAARLTAVPVAVVAQRGVGDAVESTVALLRQAGATAPVIVWLEQAWVLEDAGDVERLAGVLGYSAATDTGLLRRRGLAALAERLAQPAESGAPGEAADEPAAQSGSGRASTTVAPPTTAAPDGPDVLDALDEAGFITVEEIGGPAPSADSVPDSGEPGRGADAVVGVRFLLVGGTGSELLDTEVLIDLARACLAEDAPTVVATVYAEADEGPERGEALMPLIDDETLGETVSTVDALELVEGRVSAVLSLEGLAEGRVGHFGYGDAASGILPEWVGR